VFEREQLDLIQNIEWLVKRGKDALAVVKRAVHFGAALDQEKNLAGRVPSPYDQLAGITVHELQGLDEVR
jgi:hypothetical protein